MENVGDRFVVSDTVSVAASPAALTDIFEVINSSQDRRVFINYVLISGTAGTSITLPVVGYRRTADTGGTSAAVTVYQTNSSNSVSLGVTAKKYTANPTIAGTSQEIIRDVIALTVTTAVTAKESVEFEFCGDGIALAPGESFAINLAGTAIVSGIVQVSVQGFVDRRGI